MNEQELRMRAVELTVEYFTGKEVVTVKLLDETINTFYTFLTKQE